MSGIKIDVRNVICASGEINAARKEAISARTGIRGTLHYFEPQVRSRNSLDIRLNLVCDHISRIENKMAQIDHVVSGGLTSIG